MVRHHTLGNYGEADLSPVRSWVLDRVGHQPTSWAGPSRTSENSGKAKFTGIANPPHSPVPMP